MKASPRCLKTETFGSGSTPLQKTGIFEGPEVSYHQTYSARDWLCILRTPYPIQNLQRKHRTDSQMTTKARKRALNPGNNSNKRMICFHPTKKQHKREADVSHSNHKDLQINYVNLSTYVEL